RARRREPGVRGAEAGRRLRQSRRPGDDRPGDDRLAAQVRPSGASARCDCRRQEVSVAVSRRARVIVTGIVQGVGFRMYAQRQARSLGVGGYVRNLPGGEVEMVTEGDREAVERLIAWAHVGPPSAEIDAVRVTEEKPTEEFIGFDIRA